MLQALSSPQGWHKVQSVDLLCMPVQILWQIFSCSLLPSFNGDQSACKGMSSRVSGQATFSRTWCHVFVNSDSIIAQVLISHAASLQNLNDSFEFLSCERFSHVQQEKLAQKWVAIKVSMQSSGFPNYLTREPAIHFPQHWLLVAHGEGLYKLIGSV